MTARGRAPRAAPPATRSQNPAPKSAPANTAYALTATNNTTATASATDGLCFLRRLRQGLARAVRDVAVDQLGLAPEPPAHAPEHEDDRRRESQIDDHDDDERDPDALVAG